MLKFAHAAFMGSPGVATQHAQEAPAIMLVPMGILVAGCIAVGLLPGLLLVPIAAILQQLGMTPIEMSWTGALPVTGGWHPAMLSVLLLAGGLIATLYLRQGRGAAVIRSPIHLCGVADIASAQLNVNAANLFESPDAAIRGLLHAKHDTGYSDENDEANDDAESSHDHLQIKLA